MFTEIIREFLIFLTLLTHIGFIIMIVYPNFLKKLREYPLQFSFVVALTATLGSLFFSELMLWEPCKLCWFQRIFMYPLVLILAIALKNKDKKVGKYVIPMAVIGALISTYHYLMSIMPRAESSGICTTTGSSCLVEYFTAYGYVTIPMMALTAFVLIIILMWKKK